MTDYVQQWKSLSYAELKELPVYKRLTEKAKNEAGKTKEEMIQFLETKIFPLQSSSLSDFVFHEWLVYMTYFSKDLEMSKLYAFVGDIASSSPDACVTKGVTGMIQFSNLMVIWQNAAEIGVADFIPVICATNETDWQKRFAHRFQQALLYSRLHYIYNGKYLPIVVDMALQPQKHQASYQQVGHASSFLFIPNNDTLYWNRILIDSSGASKIGDLRDVLIMVTTIMDTKWEEFVKQKETYQTDIIRDLDFKDVYEKDVAIADCVRDIQGDVPTCAYWNFGFLVNFLYNYNLHPKLMSDKHSMEFWCTKFQEVVQTEDSRTAYFMKLNQLVITVQKYIKAFIWMRFYMTPVFQLNVQDYVNYFRYPVTNSDLTAMAESKKYYTEIYDTITKWNLFNVITTQDMYKMHEIRSPTRPKQIHSEIKVKEEPSDEGFIDYPISPIYYPPSPPHSPSKLKVEEAVKIVRKDLKITVKDMMIDHFYYQRVCQETEKRYDYLLSSDIDRAVLQLIHNKMKRKHEKKKESKENKETKLKNQINAEKALEKVRKQLHIKPRMLAEKLYRDIVINEMKSQYPYLTPSDLDGVTKKFVSMAKSSRKQREKSSQRGRKLTVKGAILRVMKEEKVTRKTLKHNDILEHVLTKVKETYPQFSEPDVLATINTLGTR